MGFFFIYVEATGFLFLDYSSLSLFPFPSINPLSHLHQTHPILVDALCAFPFTDGIVELLGGREGERSLDSWLGKRIEK